jgi:uncharacterized membrane protein YoaK (UPF0700 family)
MATIEEHKVTLPANGGRLAPATVRDVLLASLAVSSGAVDAISWLALGKVFSAFMTGNIVFLALSVTGAGGPSVAQVAVSLAAFAAGVLLAVRIVKASRGAGVWPRRVSLALGVSALAQAAFLAGWLATSGQPSTGAARVLIGLSALAMGVQSGAVMSLGIPGVFTTAATATLIDLVSDVAGWSRSASEQRRFAGVLAGLFAGAAAGAVLVVHAPDYAPVLPLIATVLVIAAASIALPPSC